MPRLMILIDCWVIVAKRYGVVISRFSHTPPGVHLAGLGVIWASARVASPAGPAPAIRTARTARAQTRKARPPLLGRSHPRTPASAVNPSRCTVNVGPPGPVRGGGVRRGIAASWEPYPHAFRKSDSRMVSIEIRLVKTLSTAEAYARWGFRQVCLSRTLLGPAPDTGTAPLTDAGVLGTALLGTRASRPHSHFRGLRPRAGGTPAFPGAPCPCKQLRGVKSDKSPSNRPQKPRRNAVSVGVKNISTSDLHPLYRYVTSCARGSVKRLPASNGGGPAVPFAGGTPAFPGRRARASGSVE